MLSRSAPVAKFLGGTPFTCDDCRGKRQTGPRTPLRCLLAERAKFSRGAGSEALLLKQSPGMEVKPVGAWRCEVAQRRDGGHMGGIEGELQGFWNAFCNQISG